MNKIIVIAFTLMSFCTSFADENCDINKASFAKVVQILKDNPKCQNGNFIEHELTYDFRGSACGEPIEKYQVKVKRILEIQIANALENQAEMLITFEDGTFVNLGKFEIKKLTDIQNLLSSNSDIRIMKSSQDPLAAYIFVSNAVIQMKHN